MFAGRMLMGRVIGQVTIWILGDPPARCISAQSAGEEANNQSPLMIVYARK